MTTKNFHTPLEWLKVLSGVFDKVEASVKSRPTDLLSAFQSFESLLMQVRQNQGTVWWVGNGGSAAVCAHLSQDLLNKASVRSVFCNDAALLTCMANDFGYENVYSKPLSKLANKGDMLIAISSSGNSDNIISCVQTAKNLQMTIVSLSGFEKGNRLNAADTAVDFFVPSKVYGIVEIAHEALIHSLIETIQKG